MKKLFIFIFILFTIPVYSQIKLQSKAIVLHDFISYVDNYKLSEGKLLLIDGEYCIVGHINLDDYKFCRLDLGCDRAAVSKSMELFINTIRDGNVINFSDNSGEYWACAKYPETEDKIVFCRLGTKNEMFIISINDMNNMIKKVK